MFTRRSPHPLKLVPKGKNWEACLALELVFLSLCYQQYSTSCNFTQLGKINLSKLISEIKQFQKLCIISSAVCHHQRKQFLCSKLAFGDTGIQLRSAKLSQRQAWKVKCVSVSNSVCSMQAAREREVCQCRVILFPQFLDVTYVKLAI